MTGIIMNNNETVSAADKHLARKVRRACIEAAKEGFKDASMSGLCAEGAMEAAISAMQSLDVISIIDRETSSE